jgi:hypothetical protein
MVVEIKYFGIRHHGPGSSRSLLKALNGFKPDCLLVEGPPDAEEIIPLAKDKQLKPPVAVLIYNTKDLKKAVYYPFAEFSPEWQAMKYALGQDINLSFIDLPQKYQLITQEKSEPKQEESKEETVKIKADPLNKIAQLTGDGDGERWWHRVIEENQSGEDVFAEVANLLKDLRQDLDLPQSPREERREAYMRQEIREAKIKGYSKIAVICGAWHVSALQKTDQEKEDKKILQGLKSEKVAATWIPWTYNRLTFAGGYGAGIDFPGWYHHLWHNPKDYSVKWLVKIAGLLRNNGFDSSTAEVIDTFRLAENLTILRGQRMPGLRELMDSTQTSMLQGKKTKIKLIKKELLITDRIGKVPENIPVIPLQKDIQDEMKALRFKSQSEFQELDLDLRKETHLKRSHFLHRLGLLEINWGQKRELDNKTNTFHELWTLEWQPELNIAIIDAGKYGNTLPEACRNKIKEELETESGLEKLSKLLEAVILADLSESIEQIIRVLQAKTIDSRDNLELLKIVPPLARLTRYGSVRSVDQESILSILKEIILRVSLGLPGSIHSLDYETGSNLKTEIQEVNYWIRILQDQESLTRWNRCLQQIVDQDSTQRVTNGLAVRILLDAGEIKPAVASEKINLALNTSVDTLQAAGWLEGFLHGSSSLLLQDDELWAILNNWVKSLEENSFISLLPLLRRCFSAFGFSERQMLTQKAKQPIPERRKESANNPDFTSLINTERAAKILPILEEYLQANRPETKN